MALDEKGRFYERIEGRVELNSDLRAGLREAILTNQTLKALVYIEMLFDELDNKSTTTPKTTTPKKTRTKSTSSKATTKKESEEQEDGDSKEE